jgi:hypothetical protein
MAPTIRKRGGAAAPVAIRPEAPFSISHMLFLILFLMMMGILFIVSKGSGNHHPPPMWIQSYPSFISGGGGGVGFSSTPMASPLFPTSSRPSDALSDPYFPPLKNDIFMASNPPALLDVRGPPVVPVVPVNIPSRGYDTPYSQIGILNRADGKDDDLILPLMGKQATTGRDKYNYYTISNSGNLNTKLPVRVKGKSGLSEYGCDEVYSGDTVFVDGYNGKFKTTIYDNEQFRYLPAVL